MFVPGGKVMSALAAPARRVGGFDLSADRGSERAVDTAAAAGMVDKALRNRRRFQGFIESPCSRGGIAEGAQRISGPLAGALALTFVGRNEDANHGPGRFFVGADE